MLICLIFLLEFTVFFFTDFRLVRRAAAELDRLTAQGMNPHIAWNKASVLLIDAAKVNNILIALSILLMDGNKLCHKIR